MYGRLISVAKENNVLFNKNAFNCCNVAKKSVKMYEIIAIMNRFSWENVKLLHVLHNIVENLLVRMNLLNNEKNDLLKSIINN